MNKFKKTGYKSLVIVEDIGLIVISIATIVAMSIEVVTMVKAMHVGLTDLLLLFIYLEVLAMAALYLKSGKLPVRIPLYIAIVAIARYMILDMKNLDTFRLLGLAAAILILVVSVLVMRYGHFAFPYSESDDN